MKHEESKIQQALIQWARWKQHEIPELKLLHAIPNGGSRRIQEAVRLKKEGVLAGVLDLFLPCSRHGKHGLYLECKTQKGKLTPTQEEFIELLKWQNYEAQIFRSLDQGISILEHYLK